MAGLDRDSDALLALAFSLHANPGAYALLLGAGVSAPSGIPTAWGVLEDLTSRLAELSGADTDDAVRWYESRYGDEPRYETLLEKLAPTPLERQRLLRGFFEPSADDVEAGRKAPTMAHRAIARMVRSGSIKVIVTLNFDRLIEQAVRAEGIEPTVVASPADVEGLAPLHTLDCCVIHLHGDYLNPTSMLNTTAELEAYKPATVKLLHRVLEDYGLILAGWSSVYDPALRDAIAAHYPSRLTLAWIEPGRPSTEATELRTLKKGLLLPVNADTGFGELADALEALAARTARHPLTVAVAVETAKRELSGRQVAISLHDRVNREFSRLHAHQDFHLPNYQTDLPYGGYDLIRGRVEEASRVCCALVSTLAYWGDRASDEWWINEIERFSVPIRANGLTNLLSLKLVAGSALYYSAGIAAISARRYELVTRLLNATRPDPYSTGLQPLSLALGSEETAAGPRLYTLVRPLLHEALSLGDAPLEDAWQAFEVLRLAKTAMSHQRFGDRLGRLNEMRLALADAQQRFDEAQTAGNGADGAQQERAAAWQNHGLALGAIADIVRLRGPHILVVDRGEGFRSPVAERLAADISTEAASNPFIRAQLAEDPTALGAAVAAVSVAAGRRGTELAWNRLPPGGGVEPDEIWIDTGKTPSELAAAA